MDSFRGDGLNLYAYVRNNPVNYIDPTGYCGELLTEDEFYNLTKKIIDSAEGRPYTYTPKEWETEFANNIEPMIDMIPTDLADSQRQPLVDAIIISEAYKLQGKYGTAYHASNNVISKYITERGFHQTLEPLFTQYPTKDKPTNGLLKAFLEGFSSGFKAGIIQGAMDWGATYNKGTPTIQTTSKPIFKNGKVTVESLKANAKSFSGKSADDIADMLRKQGYDVTIEASKRSTSGAKIIKIHNAGNGRNISRFKSHLVVEGMVLILI